MSKRFRNAMVNFKSEEDLEIYLKKFSKEIPKLMPEIRQMTICRASKDSLLHFVTYNSEEEQNLATCLLYTSDAADEEDSVDLGGRRIIKTDTTDKQWYSC